MLPQWIIPPIPSLLALKIDCTDVFHSDYSVLMQFFFLLVTYLGHIKT